MANFRIFVEKHPEFNVEARQLLNSINQDLHLKLTKLRVCSTYDIFNITDEEFERTKYVIFAEPPLDSVYEKLPGNIQNYFAIEPIPGQYDQRADSALQSLNLLSINNPELSVTTAKVIIIDDVLSDKELQAIKKYCINPLEMREKDLSIFENNQEEPVFDQVPHYEGFINLNGKELDGFRSKHDLAMTLADLQCIQSYFIQEKRDPTETEIKVLDTYWSDHCRHTTFETILTEINFEDGKYKALLDQVFLNYLQTRQNLYRNKDKPITLMDLATISGKYLRKEGLLSDVEISDEINACSLMVEIMVDDKPEIWSLQFKNETHNHPTEIEPFGGASTCVGGAIRDPLSGRAYVYQAMRITGAADPLEDVSDTLAGKLAQRVITTKAAHGFSSYGNQIGLATTHVREIYHTGYKAKRMEVGMVVAAAPYSNIRREGPKPNDIIILVGGKTGRDGCGGATGSSKEHDVNSSATCSAEVQKGNPIVERKIQRLFRNPEVSKLIKKCNDFGAGGVSVAIGELADGVAINLDLVPTKYNGLNGTELAISESQERMAVVIDKADADRFIKLAEKENLEAHIVAKVTDEARMIMQWRGQTIVDLSREFLNTNGAKSYARIEVANPVEKVSFSTRNIGGNFGLQITNLVSELNVCSQQGLIDMFDATIGGGTVLMPLGGKYQLSPSQVSVQKLPVLNGNTDAASVASYGFDPELSTRSPFHGALYAVIDSVAKIVASGANHEQIRFSFQEYFERLNNDPLKWGKPFAALLGAFHAQSKLGLAAIGGKDSMSGSFNELNVPPTLISFAVAPTHASKTISCEFKRENHYIYVYMPKYDDHLIPDFNNLTKAYKIVTDLIHNKVINAARAIGYGGIAEAVFLMSIGNRIGAQLYEDNTFKFDLFTAYYGGMVLVSEKELRDANFVLVGKTTNSHQLSYKDETVNLELLIQNWQAKLAPIFPVTTNPKIDKLDLELISKVSKQNVAINSIAKPRVVIPVFPGTNCEYDSLRAFVRAGAVADSMVFNNLSISHIRESIQELAKQINNSQILMLPGGFSAGDEPDGSAKFIAVILRNQEISDAVHNLLARDGLILGICNGFQALVKSGLLPYGKIQDLDSNSLTLTYNLIGRHISRIVPTKVVANHSPWLSSFKVGEVKHIAMSHGEGRFIVNPKLAHDLAASGQIACQYADLSGNPTMDGYFNPNGSDYAIEAISSQDGRILGKMGHSERIQDDLYKNIYGDKTQNIFANGVGYYK